MSTARPLTVVVLAAGMGTRLGKPFPKPLTPLADGRTILHQALDNVYAALGQHTSVRVVVGFKCDLVMEHVPDVTFVYNERFDSTNTNRSLLKALRTVPTGGVLWMNGDVVFDPAILTRLAEYIDRDRSVVAVNTAAVADEEVKYTVDDDGYIRELSKTISAGPLGEAVGINFVAEQDRDTLARRLEQCEDQDYFERGIELAIALDGMRVLPVDISDLFAVEVDFEQDLVRANAR